MHHAPSTLYVKKSHTTSRYGRWTAVHTAAQEAASKPCSMSLAPMRCSMKHFRSCQCWPSTAPCQGGILTKVKLRVAQAAGRGLAFLLSGLHACPSFCSCMLIMGIAADHLGQMLITDKTHCTEVPCVWHRKAIGSSTCVKGIGTAVLRVHHCLPFAGMGNVSPWRTP